SGADPAASSEFESFQAPPKRAVQPSPAIRERLSAAESEHGPDWRSALRATGADPSAAGAKQPRPPADGSARTRPAPTGANSTPTRADSEMPSDSPAGNINPLLT